MPPPRRSLNVLPSSNKAEELKRELAADPPQKQPKEHEPSMPTDQAAPGESIAQQSIRAAVVEVLRTIYDPELPLSIYELGLIYDIDVREDSSVHVKMTLTAPGCPVAGTLPGEVQRKIAELPDVSSAKVELVWDPPWTKDRLSEAALLQLGLL